MLIYSVLQEGVKCRNESKLLSQLSWFQRRLTCYLFHNYHYYFIGNLMISMNLTNQISFTLFSRSESKRPSQLSWFWCQLIWYPICYIISNIWNIIGNQMISMNLTNLISFTLCSRSESSAKTSQSQTRSKRPSQLSWFRRRPQWRWRRRRRRWRRKWRRRQHCKQMATPHKVETYQMVQKWTAISAKCIATKHLH